MNNLLPLVIGEWACSKGRRGIGERGRAIAQCRAAGVGGAGLSTKGIVLRGWCLLHRNGGMA